MAGGCAASQSDARFEKSSFLKWLLTWGLLSDPGLTSKVWLWRYIGCFWYLINSGALEKTKKMCTYHILRFKHLVYHDVSLYFNHLCLCPPSYFVKYRIYSEMFIEALPCSVNVQWFLNHLVVNCFDRACHPCGGSDASTSAINLYSSLPLT